MLRENTPSLLQCLERGVSMMGNIKATTMRTRTCGLRGRRPVRLLVLLLLVAAACLASSAAAGAQDPVTVDISLHGNPTGSDRVPYEEILKYFADGVFESSEGGVKIGVIRIFPNFGNVTKADIRWEPNGWPKSSVSGVGHPGSQLHMFDVFGSLKFLKEDAANGGYTLAHEWGHYYFGLRDEYSKDNVKNNEAWKDSDLSYPHTNDEPVADSIMNLHWNAVGDRDIWSQWTRHYQWLNFSTNSNAQIQDNNKPRFRNTVQYRIYGASGWGTLSRPTAQDAKPTGWTAAPHREFYPVLRNVAPALGLPARIDLPDPAARSALTIRWMDPSGAVQIVIDRSGSMGTADKLEKAKAAAKVLVDLATPGTAVGVISFDDVVTQEAPLTAIVDHRERDYLKACIDRIVPGDTTAVGDAAQSALDWMVAYESQLRGVVFLLSDGMSNSGAAPLSVVPSYLMHDVPIVTFAYGSDADQTTLRAMAAGTFGEFYFSPTSLNDLTSAFASASGWATPSASMASASASVAPGAVGEYAFNVDPSLKDLYLAVTYGGTIGDATVQAVDPSGQVFEPSDSQQVGASVQHSFSINAPRSGRWLLRVTSTSGSALDVSYVITGSPGSQLTYRLTLDAGGGSVQYPSPIVVSAVLAEELPIRGACVTATIEAPDGSTSPVVLHDDGLEGDAIANDGRYSAILGYTMNGVYTLRVWADNANGTAAQTSNGLQLSAPPPGFDSSPPGDVPITESFERFAQTQVTVEGFRSDDHGNTTGTATAVVADNTDVPGRIDYAGDPDFFRVDVPAGTTSLVFRVTSTAFGMVPKISIWNAAGTTVLKSATLSPSGDPDQYLVVMLPTAGESVLFAEVEHGDPSQTGVYCFSAGPAIGSDWEAPTLTSFAPASGPVGTVVTLTGTGLTGATAVAFSGVAATFSVVSDTQISATVPESATGGKIAVTTPGGSDVSAASFILTPTITSFTPASGVVGTSVTLTGTGFIGVRMVAFNRTAALFSVVSATQITATVPAGPSSGPISVITHGGAASSAASFTVTRLPIPTPIPTPTSSPTPVPTPTSTPTLPPTPAFTLAPTVTSFLPASGPVGAAVIATGAVTPSNVIGSRVTLSVEMKEGATWVKVRTTSTSSRPVGKYRWKYAPAERGTYRMRATVPEDEAHAGATTTWLVFTVK